MSLLILKSSPEERKKKAIQIACEIYKSSALDTIIVEKGEKGNIAISQVKEVKIRAILTPFNSPSKTIVFFELQKATLEAQNALLKLIEEPPPNTFIIITSPSEHLLLPPIVSRCTILKVKEEKNNLQKDKDWSKNVEELIFLFMAKNGQRLEKAEKLAKNKEEGILWIKNLILSLKSLLFSELRITSYELQKMNDLGFPKETDLILAIRRLLKALSTLENTNTNSRLLLENLLLEFASKEC